MKSYYIDYRGVTTSVFSIFKTYWSIRPSKKKKKKKKNQLYFNEIHNNTLVHPNRSFKKRFL